MVRGYFLIIYYQELIKSKGQSHPFILAIYVAIVKFYGKTPAGLASNNKVITAICLMATALALMGLLHII